MLLYIFYCLESFALKDFISILISITAVAISITIFYSNRKLNIKQNILKTALDKAKDCNEIWKNEGKEKDNPHYDLISELLISKELIEISYDLYNASHKDKQKYSTAFWKQLRTGLRGFYISESFIRAKKFNEDAIPKHKTTYCKQVLKIYEFISIGNLEKRQDDNVIDELNSYPELPA